jgi:hypothetical protein
VTSSSIVANDDDCEGRINANDCGVFVDGAVGLDNDDFIIDL